MNFSKESVELSKSFLKAGFQTIYRETDGDLVLYKDDRYVFINKELFPEIPNDMMRSLATIVNNPITSEKLKKEERILNYGFYYTDHFDAVDGKYAVEMSFDGATLIVKKYKDGSIVDALSSALNEHS